MRVRMRVRMRMEMQAGDDGRWRMEEANEDGV